MQKTKCERYFRDDSCLLTLTNSIASMPQLPQKNVSDLFITIVNKFFGTQMCHYHKRE
jgi:hypothetical protein